MGNPKFNKDPVKAKTQLPITAIPVDATVQTEFINFPSIDSNPATASPQEVPFQETGTAEFWTIFQNPQIELILSSNGGVDDRL